MIKKTLSFLMLVIFLCTPKVIAVSNTFLDYQNYNHGYCPDCNCAPCSCNPCDAPCEDPCEEPCEPLCEPCAPCNPCDPCAPMCGSECGVSLCAIGVAIAALAVAAVIIAVSGTGG